MTEQRICKTCGTPADGSAAFCSVCDTYLGWSVNASAPEARQPDAAPRGRVGVPGGAGGAPPQEPDPRVAQQREARPDRVVVPVASVKQAEVTLTAAAPATFEVDVKNDSTIVDSYTIQAADPPPWLTVTHGEANLLPGVLRTVQVTFAITPGVLAVAQRVTVPLFVRSGVDATRATPLSIVVDVPRSGPAATLVARPNLIRLVDSDRGSLHVQLDNRAANFARQYVLTATDPEGVVRVEFVPAAVDVPAGGSAEAEVRFAAPPPPPGKDLARQLTLTATDSEGQVGVAVTVEQSTSPPPESLPARIRLEPAEIAMADRTTAELNVVLDNRGGHEAVKFNLSGRDPGNQVGFRFEHARVAVREGSLGYVGLVVQTAPIARGESDSRPFSVVATTDDGREIEAAGSLELSAHPDPITTARLYIQPEHLVVKGRKGKYAVDVDNRQGGEPLQVRLSGSDEFGRARITFQPELLAVPPGQVGRSIAAIDHPRPDGGSSSTRQVQVAATSLTGSVDGRATFTQQTNSYRKLWAVLLVLLGATLLAVAAIGWAANPPVDGVTGAVDRLTSVGSASDVQAADVVSVTTTVFLGLVLFSIAMMLLGLIGAGRLVRVSAIFAALWTGAVVATHPVATFFTDDPLGSVPAGLGLAFALPGAVLAFIGGILLKP
ncbi:hypothetical protein [Nocardioides panacisoli]|uniref:Zinc ribbon domain-containing protein n=1 Tax=Nocardioides panacisoli TaxID=627624 RepID=A0ABP7HVG7_9ACTN